MSENESYEGIREDSLASLADGDAKSAFQKFRRMLCFGTEYLASAEKFSDAFRVFGEISESIAGDEFAKLSHDVASEPTNVQALYDLGYATYEHGLFSISALVLDRANKLAPNQPGIVSELVCALEGDNLSKVAVDVLKENTELTRSGFTFAYLLGFNQFMSGDLVAARLSINTMSGLAENDDHRLMQQRIQGFVDRADLMKTYSNLNDTDLRGWHYAINESVLLEMSPFGFPDPMSGRYAYLAESYESCKNGIQQLKSFLDGVAFEPKTVFSLPDRNSLIISNAISKMFGCDVRAWPENGTDEPGVIVSFNLSDSELSEPLSNRREGQLLYSHVLTWTEACPIAPDIVYQLAQTVVEPWGVQMHVNPETEQLEQTEEDHRSPELVAENILNADLADRDIPLEDSEEKPPELSGEFVSCLAGFGSRNGVRGKYWVNSPVHSARFG